MNGIVATRTPRLRPPATAVAGFAAVCASAFLIAACGGDEETPTSTAAEVGEPEPSSGETEGNAADLDRVVNVDGDRGLYVRCTGTGSPTVVMEGGDGDTSDSYFFAEDEVAQTTRTCVYDRANLGQSDPAPGPRGLEYLVGDLEALLESAEVPGPYVLVGTSGGGFITAGYAVEHPDEVAGMVFVDTGAPFEDPPQAIVKETDPSHPANVEKRDYLQVEKDAWAARESIGDVPIRVISVKFSKADIAASPFASEQALMRENVDRQKGWLVLSPSAEQIVVETGHAVEEEDPKVIVDTILEVVEAARQGDANTAADTGLVGEWSTENVCEDQLRAFKEAGLADPGTEWAEFPGQKPTDSDPCHGAKPVEHSHSFGENGSFDSYDQNGEQVDDGTYTPVDDRTFTLGDPPVTVHYRIEGDKATFDVVDPACQTKRCRESAAYVTSVFFPRTYERVR
jgi:alpha/beta hydrolase fold